MKSLKVSVEPKEVEEKSKTMRYLKVVNIEWIAEQAEKLGYSDSQLLDCIIDELRKQGDL